MSEGNGTSHHVFMRARKPDGEEVRAVSLSHHTAVVMGLLGVIATLGIRLYDMSDLPRKVGTEMGDALRKEFTRTLDERDRTVSATFDRLDQRINGVEDRVDRLEKWRDDERGYGWRREAGAPPRGN